MPTTPTTTPGANIGTSASVPAQSGITGGQVQSAYEKPYAPSIADLLDEEGNSTKKVAYGNGSIIEHQAVVALDCSASVGSITLGGDEGVASVSISTSNGAWPMATVIWYTGLPECKSSTEKSTSITVLGKRKAQLLGLTGSGMCQNSTWTASASLNLLLNPSGEPAAYAFTGANITASATVIGGSITAGDLILTDGPTESSSNTAFPTVTASGTKAL